MKTTNKLDSVFAPIGDTLGYVLIISGIAASFQTLNALILIFLGIFLAFTRNFVTINPSSKKIKTGLLLFGIIPYAKTIDLKQGMKLKIIKKNYSYRLYSRSNRTLDVNSGDYRIVLLVEKMKPIKLKKTFSLEFAKKEIESLKLALNLEIANKRNHTNQVIIN